jgi:hypothetical protein
MAALETDPTAKSISSDKLMQCIHVKNAIYIYIHKPLTSLQAHERHFQFQTTTKKQGKRFKIEKRTKRLKNPRSVVAGAPPRCHGRCQGELSVGLQPLLPRAHQLC